MNKKSNKITSFFKVFNLDNSTKIEIPLFVDTISAGFPSPADDYIEEKLDLNKHLIKHPEATFYVKAKGNSMINIGIFEDDILIVDRSLDPANNSIVIGVVNGEFTVKRINKSDDKFYLIPENDNFPPIEITESMDFKIWGVVTNAIHKL
ncbi:MAG: translesion error-prone DNA polymerase V autoproteolytic subunit [Bacteroidetes bacterium]|nr:translesion error-prone DNA polymerase V autoproteolytic subunit [Bacteroidota bacterium]